MLLLVPCSVNESWKYEKAKHNFLHSADRHSNTFQQITKSHFSFSDKCLWNNFTLLFLWWQKRLYGLQLFWLADFCQKLSHYLLNLKCKTFRVSQTFYSIFLSGCICTTFLVSENQIMKNLEQQLANFGKTYQDTLYIKNKSCKYLFLV